MAANEERPQPGGDWAAWLDAELSRDSDDEPLPAPDDEPPPAEPVATRDAPGTDAPAARPLPTGRGRVGSGAPAGVAGSTSARGTAPIAPIIRPSDAAVPPSTPPHSTDPLDSTDPGGIPDPSRPPVRAAAALAGPNTEPPTSTKRKRISRWERPPEPHDWRWVVGHIGRALITVGLLMFGFVAYQLWGTGLQTARAQHELKSEFNDKRASLPAPPDTIAPATSSTVVPTTSAVPADTTPSGTDAPTTTTLPPAPATTVPTGPVDQNYDGIVHDGDGLGEIKIKKIDVDFIYIAGVTRGDLDRGVGHFPKSVSPGQLGNAALAGHRTSHKAPFYDLDKLEPGDEIEIYTVLGGAYLYVVTGSEVVEPSDYHVVTDSDPNKATLTLITCTPKFSSKQRLVVHADLDVTRSSPVGIGEIYYGEATPDPSLASSGDLPDDGALPSNGAATTALAADSTTTMLSATSTVPATATATTEGAEQATTTLLASVTATTGSPAATTSPATTQPAAGSVIDVEDEFADDAFDQGWFDDTAALPHVFGWGALFALVWYGAYRLAKRYRRMWLGIAVGFVPFVVVLYFFYENVNRLLPAAI